MNSVSKIMEKLYEGDHPLEKRDNESFSIPFITEYKERIWLAVFSYHRPFSFGGKGGAATAKMLYLIDPGDLSNYQVIDISNAEVRNDFSRLPLFSVDSTEARAMKPYERYEELVKLSDFIVKDDESAKDVISQYAALISASVADDLLQYYMEFGGMYFYWLNTIFEEKSH